MKPKRSFVLGFAVLAVALVALLVFTIPTKYSRRSQRLPDGSSLKIVSISYGTNHSFAMPHRKPWQNFLVAHLSRSLTARLGWETTGGSIGMSPPPPGATSLAIFTLHEPLKSEVSARALMTGSGGFKVDLCDEQGNVCDSASGGSRLGGYRGKIRWSVEGWQFSKIPRDSKYLRLVFSEPSSDGHTPQQVAEFYIPNPAVTGGANSTR